MAFTVSEWTSAEWAIAPAEQIRPRSRHAPIGLYLAAVLAQALALGVVHSGLVTRSAGVALLLPLAVVTCATWFAGLGPGLLAFMLALVAEAELFVVMKGVDYGPFVVMIEGLVLGGLANLQRQGRLKAEGAAANARRSHDDVIETIPDLYGMIDLDGRLMSWNRKLEHASGRTAEELLGLPVVALCPESQRPSFLATIRRIHQTGHGGVTTELVSADGVITPYQWSGMPVQEADGRVVGIAAIGHDVTERKAFEAKLREQNEVVETINRVGRLLSAELDLRKLVQAVTDAVAGLTGAESAVFFTATPEPDDESSRLFAVSGGRAADAAFRGTTESRSRALFQAMLRGEEVVRVDDVSIDPRFDPFRAPEAGGHEPFGSLLAVPVASRSGVVLGGLVLTHRRTSAFSGREERLVVGLAAQAATALDNARLYRAARQEIAERKLAEERNRALNAELQRRLERIDALRRIDEAITAGPDRRHTLGVILDQVMSQLRVDAAAFSLCDPDGQTLVTDTSRGFRTQEIGRVVARVGEGLAGRVAAGARGVIARSPAEFQETPARASVLKAEGFVAYHGVPLIAKGQVKGVLEVFHRNPVETDGDWTAYLEALAGQAAIAVDNAELFAGLQRSNLELTIAYDATIEGWARALDLRDKETEGHTRRVTEMTLRLARSMGIGPTELAHIRRGSLLHDIGKLGIPDAILLKPGPLDDAEREVMRRHPTYAYEWLSPITYLRNSLDIPYCHHETWEGTGYPRGLKGRQIPLSARIFAAVDIWDALSHDRPYRKAWPAERVREHLRGLAGNHLDPWIVERFVSLLEEDDEARTSSPAVPASAEAGLSLVG